MWVAAAIVASAVVGGVVASNASSKASKAQTQAANTQAAAATAAADQANDTQWAMYQQSRADMMPWLTVGTENLTKLNAMVAGGPGDYAGSPYYQLGLKEQNLATDTYNASRGLYASGKAAKDLQANAVTNMNLNRGNWLNEWITTKLNPTQSLANVGQTAASNMGGNALSTGNAVAGNTRWAGDVAGNAAMTAGNARASGYINQANAITGPLQGGVNALAMYYGSGKGGGGGTINQPRSLVAYS